MNLPPTRMISLRAFRAPIVGVVLTLAGLPTVDAQPATLVIGNARIYTGNPAKPWATTLAVRGARIVAVGDSAVARAYLGPRTRRIDGEGRLVIPGLNDAHTHLAFAVPAGVTITTPGDPIGGVAPAELLDSIRAVASRTPKGIWIRGMLGMRVIGDTAFRRDALDTAAPDHPVLLSTVFGHLSLANTRALRAAGLADSARDPLGGRLERANGRLTGLADEYAQWPLWEADLQATWTPGRDPATRGVVQALRIEADSASAQGVTSVQAMGTPFSAEQAVRAFRSAGLSQHVRLWPMPGTTASGRALAGWPAVPTRVAADVTVRGRKYVLDGTPIEGNALSRRAYANRPGWYGRLNFPVDTIKAILRDAVVTRVPLALHIVGDSTLVIVLDAMEAVAPDSVWRPLRVRLEHANGVRGPLVERARRLGIVIGQPRIDSSPLRTWLAAGIPVAYGSDASGAPWRDFQGFVARRDTTEQITREQALALMTSGGAYAEFAERDKGRLQVGMLADFAMLSHDVLSVPASALPATRSVLTVLAGRIVHDRR